MSPDTYLTRSQVAEYLGVHPGTIDRMVADGRLPKPLKLSRARNGRCRYSAASIQAAIVQLGEAS